MIVGKVLKVILCILFMYTITPVISFSQHLNHNLEFYSLQTLNYAINNSKKNVHSSFKPLLKSDFNNNFISDSLFFYKDRDRIFSDKFKAKWIYRKIRSEDFVDYQSDGLILKINPLFNLSYEKSEDYNQTFYINTRGVELKGSIGEKVSFYSAFYENQARFEPYINEYINTHRVAPGQGAIKILENSKFDFSRSSAYLTIKPLQKLSIQIGHSKHFVGEGYRSLLLSDNAFNYPYLKLSANFGKFKYLILWNQYQLFKGAYYNYHQRKYGSVLYLSWVPNNKFEFAFFESIMWPGNTPSEKSNFNIAYFNPLLLSRGLIYGLNNKKNVLLGFNSRIKLYDFAQFFAQFALDDIGFNNSSRNKYAFQVGLKHFDLFHQKLPQHCLFFHSEYNFISPYTYSWDEPQQSISHYNQPLTHPVGSGLQEFVASLNYCYKDFSLKLKGSFLVNSLDTTNSNFGSNIFLAFNETNTGNVVGQGVKNELIHLYSEVSFTINSATNMQLFAGLHIRESINAINQIKTLFYSFGIKTNINNYYFDF